MITAYYAQHEMHNRERQLISSAERRRLAAEGALVTFKGDRLALAAALARLARVAKHPTAAHSAH